MKPFIEKLGFYAADDLCNMLLGKLLGSGSFRRVYEMRFCDDLVVKIESGKSFNNIAEWELWQECPAKLAKWLAPCVHISDCGTCLVQKRVAPVKARPKMIPSWLDDNKLANWGRYKGRIVCCDYGHNRAIKEAFKHHKLVDGSHMWRTPIYDI